MKSIITWFQYFFVSLFSILAPIKAIIYTLSLLIAADFIFGIYRAYKNGEKITSRKMSNSLPKIFLYNLVIIVLYYSNVYIIETGLPLEKLAAGLICLIELRSIDESWTSIFGYSIWNKLLDNIGRGKSKTKDLI